MAFFVLRVKDVVEFHYESFFFNLLREEVRPYRISRLPLDGSDTQRFFLLHLETDIRESRGVSFTSRSEVPCLRFSLIVWANYTEREHSQFLALLWS